MSEPSPLATALTGACPRCGRKGVFEDHVVRFAAGCRRCGLRFERFDVGDGPAAFLILLIGALLVVAAVYVDSAYSPDWWVHVVWLPIGAVLTILGLRFAKGLLLAQEYRYRERSDKLE